MPINRTQASKLLNSSEMALFDAASTSGVRALTPSQLQAKVERSRRLRDKHRDLYQRQRLASQAHTGYKSGRSGQANLRSKEKAQVFDEVLKRLRARLAMPSVKAQVAAARKKKASAGKSAAAKKKPAGGATSAAKGKSPAAKRKAATKREAARSKAEGKAADAQARRATTHRTARKAVKGTAAKSAKAGKSATTTKATKAASTTKSASTKKSAKVTKPTKTTKAAKASKAAGTTKSAQTTRSATNIKSMKTPEAAPAKATTRKGVGKNVDANAGTTGKASTGKARSSKSAAATTPDKQATGRAARVKKEPASGSDSRKAESAAANDSATSNDRSGYTPAAGMFGVPGLSPKAPVPMEPPGAGQSDKARTGFMSKDAKLAAMDRHFGEIGGKAIQGHIGAQDRRNQGKRDHRS